MQKIKDFFKTMFLGGLVVILPIAVLFKILVWLFEIITETVRPVTLLLGVVDNDFIAFVVVIGTCFGLGLLLKTSVGHWLYIFLERHILMRIPGYRTIKEIIAQFTSGQKQLFSQVVLVSFDNHQSYFTGFVTDQYHNDRYTVFVPTAPNPTTGLIIHTKKENIKFTDITVEAAMKSIISCGSGTGKLVKEIL